MSALGHKRTLEREFGMSALLPIADMLSVGIDVRYVPITDVRSDLQRETLHRRSVPRDLRRKNSVFIFG